MDSFAALMRQQAQSCPEKLALIFLPDGEVEVGRLTYGELDRRARAFAARLQMHGLSGQSVLLTLPSSIYYVVAFLGCLYAGAVAVPCYPPTNSMHAKRLSHILADCEAQSAIVSTANGLNTVRSWLKQFSPGGIDCQMLAIDDGEISEADFEKSTIKNDLKGAAVNDEEEWMPHASKRDDIAYLQYTSGSTNHPRGVMVTHGNLLDYCRYWQVATDVNDNDVFVTWLPLFHDMGLILGVLEALYAAATIVMMPSLSFLQKPLRWLSAISRYRGTISYAPNFAYELCAASLDQALVETLDLSSWSIAGNAAEPVHADTLTRFVQRFLPQGFRPAAMNPSYGLAESTLTVTHHRRLCAPRILEVDAEKMKQGKLEKSSKKISEKTLEKTINEATPLSSRKHQTLVSCGATWMDTRVIVVDPVTSIPCESGHIGELWVHGPLVTAGYWKRPQKNAETFGVDLNRSKETVHGAVFPKGPYLRTGDLGAWFEGDLYVTGRLKDVIIIRGQNHYPHDIEHTVYRAHPALRTGHCAAFSIEVGAEEKLVIVQEVRRSQRYKIDGEEIAQAICKIVLQTHGLRPYAVQLLRPAAVHITSSGKIQRQACKQSFLKEDFDALYTWRSQEQAENSNEPAVSIDFKKSPEKIAATNTATASDIADWMTAKIAAIQNLSLAQISQEMSFANLGLDSLKIVRLSGDLAQWLERRIDPSLMYSCPTIKRVAEYLILNKSDSSQKIFEEKQKIDEAIAVIGIACRFPKANSLDEYWTLLDAGIDAITEVPDERWPAEQDIDAGQSCTKWGGFIDGVDEFDADFFGVSPREANNMDPQQRILLQTAWHAMEDANILPETLAGSDAGVFIGAMTHDYELLQVDQHVALNAYFGTGVHPSILANRLSYFFDLHGPSMTLQTACSSSLVALHSARASLLQKECSVALVGGVNTLLSNALFVALSQAKMLSPDGRCMAFDQRANGYVRSEGCAVLILKKYSDALKDKDRIHALILGSAVNQDGRSNGLTAPSGHAQQAVIRRALKVSGVKAENVAYIEAHGTGTSLGDPIEMEALEKTYGRARARESDNFQNNQKSSIWVGSVKSNIGHTEPVSGLAGLIKIILAMRHQRIPKNLHFVHKNSKILQDGAHCQVVAHPVDWLKTRQPRLAAVSAFGFGGTNAHVIVQEAPEKMTFENKGMELLLLSGKTEAALKQLMQNMVHHLKKITPQTEEETDSLFELCHAAAEHRTHFSHRAAFVCDNIKTLVQKIENASNKNFPLSQPQPGKTVFLFTGQGSQYWGMGESLYLKHALFRQTLDRCDEILHPLWGGVSLIDVLYGIHKKNDVDIDQTVYAQPALFAVEYALAMLWKSSGVQPDYLIGHSLGEYVAACVAGVFSLEDGLKLVAHRGRLMQKLTPYGVMVAVHASQNLIDHFLENIDKFLNDEIFGKNAKVSISAFNTPCDIVISGENDAIKIIADWWMRKGAVIKYLQVTRAFHTPMMQPMLQAFEETTREIHYSIPSIPIVSNVTGKIETEILANSSYWVQHVCSAVQFSAGMLDLASKGCTHWIEVGPHPILITMGQQMLEGGAWLPSLHRQIDAEKQFLEVLGTYYTAGASIDWLRWTHARLGLDPANPLPKPQACLPAYPFQTQRYWFESISDSSLKNKTFTEQNLHPILQEAIPLAACNAFYFKGQVSIKTHRLIEEHQIFDMPIWPMSASIDALIAAAQLSSNDALPEWTINDFEIVRPMFFETEQKNILLQANVTGATFERKRNIELLAKIEGNKETWQVYARGNVRPSCDGKGGIWVDTTALKKNLKEKDTTDFYQKCQKMGLGYKPGFQGLKKMWLAGNEAMAHVEISDISSKKSTLQASTSYPHHAHPAMLDACLHVAIPFMQRLGLDSQMVLLPTSIQRLTLYRSLPFSVDVHCMWLGIQGPGRYGLQFDIFDRTGRRVATLQGVQFSISHRASLLKNRHIAQQGELALYQTNWRVLETSSKSCKDKKNQEIEGIWLVLSRNSKRLKELVFACKNKHQKMNFYADSLVVIGVEQGKSLIWNGREKISLDIFKESDWAALFDMLKQRGVALRGIWLDAIEDEGQVSIESPVASAYALSQICLLTLKQFFIVYSEAIDKQHSYPDIVLCTRGAVAPPESVNLGQRLEIDNISQSVVHGLAKAMAMEMPNLKCLHVDIDPLSTIEKTPAAEAFDTWSQVTELLNICPGSAQLALRGKKSWVAQIEPMLQFQRSESSIKIDPNGIYLVTGGCRGLGLATAQWLVEKGAKYLVLIGKSISPEALVAVQNMKATGVNVEITFANVADFDSMKKGLDAALQAMQTEKKLDLKLKGIIHAAGTTRDATLVNMAWQDFSEVLDSKIKGSWNIHRLSQEKHAETLDFFILFSSIVSMTGNIGQINYVAGCAFMDSLASYRRQRGYPATSINWGYWSEIGLAARRSLSTHMAEIGVAGIETVRGLKTLEELMSINPVQAGAAQIDWLRLKKKLCPGLPSLLLDAIAKKSTDENEKTKKIEPINQKNWLQNSEISMDSAWKKSLTDMPTVQAKTQLLAYLLKCISSVLKHTQNQKTQLASNFANVTLNQIGVDSLMALEIRNNIHQSLSIHVSVSLLMTGATVNEIIDVIYGQFIAHHLMQKTLIPDLPSQAMEEITL